MAKRFGKTWWGEQWLNSLANIDYSNRLPRGSAYAHRGAVISIDIDANTIRAMVQGSRRQPYTVSITVPLFSASEKNTLVAPLIQRPAIIAKLLNLELDPEILDIADHSGLRVFPKRWNDLKMKCSCPDSAVPCKHIAAVIYKISSEIDNNPFLIFELHGVDLPKELEKTGVHIRGQKEGIIPFIKDVLLPKTKKHRETEKFQEPPDESFHALNFSSLSPIAEALIQLAEDEPVFYQNSGNFREKYAVGLHKVVRNMQRVLAGKVNIDEFFPQPHPDTGAKKSKKVAVSSMQNFADSLNHHSSVSVHIDRQDNAMFTMQGIDSWFTADVIPVLAKIPVTHAVDYQPSVSALRYALLTAFNLLANGAVVPQIIQLSGGVIAIRWLPAMLSGDVRNLIDRFQRSLPDGLLFFLDTKIAAGTAIHLLSVLLSELISRLSDIGEGDIFLDLFFNRRPYPFSNPGEQALPGGIEQWLQRYYIAQGKYRPAITVDELPEGKFSLSLHFRELGKGEPLFLKDVFSQKKYKSVRFEILQSVTPLSPFIPGLDHYINNQAAEDIVLRSKEFAPFLMSSVPAIKLLDIDILLPKSLKEILRPKPGMRVKSKKDASSGLLRLDKLLDFDWQVAIGDTLMSENEFQMMLHDSDGLLKYKTGYIYVTPEDMQKLHKHFSGSKELSPFEVMRAALSGAYQGTPVELTGEVKRQIEELTKQENIPIPDGLRAVMRPYQQRGFSWMYRNSLVGFGSVIADDMGLGKTLQIIALLLKYKEEGLLNENKALVIVPTGLLANWQAELERFAPALRYKTYHGQARSIEDDAAFDVLLTSYGVARGDVDKFKKMKWHTLVIDEAQNIKNYETAQSKAVKSIPAGTFIAMSGTPVENHLSELWNIMDFSNRGFMGNLKQFKDDFAIPIQNRNDTAAAQRLKRVISPFLMRRLKSDKSIISDLPEKMEMNAYCILTKEQAALYEKTLQKAMKQIEAVEDNDSKSLFVRQGLVLQMILALKQICNHPTQFLKNNILDAALSGKTELLFELLENIIENKEKVLIFTQFREMGDLLKHFIAERFGEEPLFYHGGCNVKQRSEMVNAFQNNRADKIFVLSLKAAGTGLNLTAASHVIHYDLWWNPAVEAQATDRAYRIGQTKNVMVHRFITKATFEERINEMIQRKKALAEMTISTGENWIGNLSNTELRDVFQLG
ncbi:MAG: DEAD/DEAH box helicase [Spirochaetia bacterium]|jgi:SNF2 family DNA or RNA helicase/uncharacterized Zn finger protein|nr:DEAD/DEAH box helicase [Spirochaetia bacterium]